MKYVHFSPDGHRRLLGVLQGSTITSLGDATLEGLLASGTNLTAYAKDKIVNGTEYSADSVIWLPPLTSPGKIVCVGLNYADHTKESNFEPQTYPTLFPRFNSSLIGHLAPMTRPLVSDSLDYEGEMAVILGGGGRHIPKDRALECVAG